MRRQRRYPQKLFLSFSSILLVFLLLVFSALWVVLYRSQYENNLQTYLQLASKTGTQMDSSLQSMDRIISGLLFNKSFMEIMQAEDFDARYTHYSKQISNSFISMDAPLFPTQRIIAFHRNVYYNVSKAEESSEYIQEAISRYPWYQQLFSQSNQKLILPVHQDFFNPKESPVYSVSRCITDGKQNYGVIEVQNTYSVLEEICKLDSPVLQTLVFSEENTQIYPYQVELAVLGELSDFQSVLSEQEAFSGVFEHNDSQFAFFRSPYSGWTTIIQVASSDVVPYARGFTAVGFLLLLAIVVCALILVRIVSKRLTAPLVYLNDALKEVSLDNLSIELPKEYGIEEINAINDSFRTMFEHLKEAIVKNVQSRASEERANYLALESQMNPHTIYNTIGMIESVSYMNGDREVSNLCICFSRMLRYISDYTEQKYTVADELAHLGNYTVLVERRYQGCLSIQMDVDPEFQDKIIPKFTLQPLVENAVKHGFSNDNNLLEVSVKIKTAVHGWKIIVEDNGKGFSSKDLAEVWDQIAECDDALSTNSKVLNRKIGGLTLTNIYLRCRILYGSNFTLLVENSQTTGGAYVELLMNEDEGE